MSRLYGAMPTSQESTDSIVPEIEIGENTENKIESKPEQKPIIQDQVIEKTITVDNPALQAKN